MPCVLRKRSAPDIPAPLAQPAKKKSKNTAATAKKALKVKNLSPSPSSPPKAEKSKNKKEAISQNPVVGCTINLKQFGGEIETHEGAKTTLQELVEESESGVILFTYPKASTPGCTTQACLFRDQYDALTSTGFSIYGLSKDSTKANTNFKVKQKLPYTLLCDPSAALITAIGLRKPPSSTTRGVFVVSKSGKILAAQAGGPAATVDVVKKLIEKLSDDNK
ncbi:Peroxiredoxin bcp1 [Golovinomyces cichoracearum]|uniref:thioredoxin-dependent peroxiredoxin n=1 Tax=Golovinomyces cichoracearum TaxID=62708 RepID=A0A420IPJ1_9PEZI|nr:Peroxiredoxin bcp1 [Golovinomyces cichoracearum]